MRISKRASHLEAEKREEMDSTLAARHINDSNIFSVFLVLPFSRWNRDCTGDGGRLGFKNKKPERNDSQVSFLFVLRRKKKCKKGFTILFKGEILRVP